MTAVLTVRPDPNLQESWQWKTNIMVAVDGTEQRAAVYQLPKRSLTFTAGAYTDKDAQALMQFMYVNSGKSFYMPWWQRVCKLSVKGTTGDHGLTFNTAVSDMRDGGLAYITDGVNSQLLTVVAVLGDGITTVEALAHDYSAADSWVAPAAEVFATDNHTHTRQFGDNYDQVSLTVSELGFVSPMLSPFNPTTLTMLGGLAVLEKRGGDAAQGGGTVVDSFNSNIDPQGYGGVTHIRSPWTFNIRAQTQLFLAQSLFDVTALPYWQAFGDYCMGALNPFYLPTWRNDFVMTAPIAPGASVFTAQGTDYHDVWHSDPAFRGVFFETPAGVHFATITGVTTSGGNSVITFDPPLPGDAGWSTQSKAGFLMLARIADDLIALQHYGSYSVVTLNLRTVRG